MDKEMKIPLYFTMIWKYSVLPEKKKALDIHFILDTFI